MIDAVVLDIDDTLSPQNSLSGVVGGLGASLAELAELVAMVRGGRVDHHVCVDHFLSLLTRPGPVTRDRLDTLFSRLELRPRTVPLVTQIVAAGLPVALISSSFDRYVEQVASRLGLSRYYSNITLTFDAGGTLTGLDFIGDTADHKHRQLHDFCRSQLLDPKRVLVVGDGDNDRDMFTCTGNGVLFAGPHNEHLRADARWIVTGLDEVARLLPARPGGPAAMG